MKCPTTTLYHTRIEATCRDVVFKSKKDLPSLYVGPLCIAFHFLSEHCVEQWLRAELSPMKLGLPPSSVVYWLGDYVSNLSSQGVSVLIYQVGYQ